MIKLKHITGAVVHYRTFDLIEIAIRTFRKFYPEMVIFVVDNSGFNEDSEKLYELSKKDGNINLFLGMEHYKHHGTGLDMVIKAAQTPYVFTFDSDAEFLKGPIEDMIKLAKPDFYAIGRHCWTNGRGHTKTKDHPHARLYIHPLAMLLNKAEYLKGPPFIRHGAPCRDAMNHIFETKQTHKLICFPDWEQYVKHDFRGTVSRHGWNLKVERRKR